MEDIEHRITKLMSKMTLDQKVGQIVQAERQFISPREVREYHIGSVLSGGGSTPGDNKADDWIRMNDAYWMASMEEGNDRLAIPIIYGVDAVHGHSNIKGAVIFPHNIGLGATRDSDLIERIAIATAREVAATGVDWTFAPNLSVARNDHWGRTYESFSEEPEVVCEYAPVFVTGLQGDFGEESVIACAKHWVGDGATNHGIDQGDVSLSEDELRRIHVPAYQAALRADVLTIMASLNSWDGIRCHGHKYLLTDVLKNELGFKGFIISDWDGIDKLSDDYAEAAVLGLNAGLDMFMITDKWKEFIEHVKNNIQRGRIPMERLDDAVRRILRVKFKFNMFTKPRPAQRKLAVDSSCFGSQQHREIAREAVRKSLVLLKNSDNTLPLDKNARILVAGKNANNRGNQCGGFTIEWQGVSGNDAIIGGTSIWEGIQAVAPNAVLSTDGAGKEADPDKHDIALVVIGELPYAEMLGDIRVAGLHKEEEFISDADASSGEKSKARSRNNIPADKIEYEALPVMDKGPYGTHLYHHQLHPEDIETIRNITSKGVPAVAIFVCGRPLVVNKELEESRAFVVAWLPGSEGQGIADVIFGDYDFQGKLSFSWPHYDDENWNVGDEGYNPLFPHGFGLTYGK